MPTSPTEHDADAIRWVDRAEGTRIGHGSPVHRPLDKRTRASIVDGISEALPRLRMRELFLQRPEILEEADHLILAADAAGVVGLTTSVRRSGVRGETFLQVPIQMIGERKQRSTLLKRMWAIHLRALLEDPDRLPARIAMRTCNPSAYRALSTFASLPGGDLYPVIGGSASTRMCEVACRIAAALHPTLPFDPRDGVLHDVGRPRDLYPDIPRSGHFRIDEYFAGRLRPSDRLLVVLELPSGPGIERLLRRLGLPDSYTRDAAQVVSGASEADVEPTPRKEGQR